MSNWKFPETVPGWLTLEEGTRLAELATNGLVLEIGGFRGRSTICMAQTAMRVCSLDWHRGDQDCGDAWTLPDFLNNLDAWNLREKVSVLLGRVEEVGCLLADETFDFVFVDGAHDFDSVCADLRLTMRCLKTGGRLAMHDIDQFSVRDAIEKTLGDAWRRLGGSANLAWGEKV